MDSPIWGDDAAHGRSCPLHLMSCCYPDYLQLRVQMLYRSWFLPTPESQFVSHLIEKKVILLFSRNHGSEPDAQLESSSRENES